VTPAVKLDSCNNLLSSIHTACIILHSVSLCIKQKYCYFHFTCWLGNDFRF